MSGLDYWSTVQPAAGLVRRVSVLAPSGDEQPLWTVAADIGQQDWSGSRASADDYPLTLVGACSVDRADAFVRACGEAVERAALLPVAPLPDAPEAPLLEPGTLWLAGGGEPTYAATVEGRAVRVPAPAVDYPLPDDDLDTFDPTPSGAAAGPSFADAAAAAAREVLERDAAVIAWARGARLPRLDLGAIARAGDLAGQRLARLLELAARIGLEPVVGVAPTTAVGVDCAIGVVIDPDGGVAAAGLAAHDSLPVAAAKAVQEALQVRTALLGVAAHYAGRPAPTRVAHDLDRARLYTTPAAVEAMRAWVDGFVVEARPERGRPDLPPPAIVDLTPRLPAPIRGLGWHAAKALSPAHQPLRMSELFDWSWNAQRLEAPEREWGIECALPADETPRASFPHPYI
jgi:ribosomal protein S12 methylthiotransferase accessory factor